MAELGLAVFTAVKEVYLLSRFIVRTAQSAARHRKERSELEAELEFEQLYIRSFGQLYIQNNGILTPHKQLNRAWLKKIGDILENLRLACGDYAKLASEHDEEYRALSPFINPPDNSILAFEDLPAQDSNNSNRLTYHCTTTNSNEVTYLSSTNLQSIDGSSQDTSQNAGRAGSRLDLDWRWALSEKRKLRKILKTFQDATRKLKVLLQLAIAANPQYLVGNIGDTHNEPGPSSPDNIQALGLRPHIVLRLIGLETESKSDLEIREGTLHMPPSDNHLAMGRYIDQGEDGETSAPENVIAEFKALDDDSPASDEERLLHLARRLAASKGSDLKTLPFRCITRYRTPKSFAFLFNFPPKTLESTPVSLHDIIDPTNARRQSLSLPYRFHIAQSIAKSLAAFHADNWVHKSLRSRSIAFFYAENGTLDFNTPYLTSFEYSRATTANTTWDYDNDPDKNLYRHPDRQRPPSISFNKLHDLWALGVVLLEIGLWDTAAGIQRDGVLKRSLSIPVDPHALKDIYLDRAKQDLEHNMGPAYAQAVQACLLGDFGCGAADVGLSLAVHTRVVGRLVVDNLFMSAEESAEDE
ncbi:hypothetical protein BCR34DRAFT_589346 [Clohesyomyces aquaticus]|uniref:Protein kinase domain-containing protein n=1 Tax=Clohesyomyces aquaticus TaxID=1231657 RepID=A0A1Y1ZGI0_9PLEO|nr:hypothetical protein BCR34DRAFT_589346 [Clohesyomyces aquaticus]